jgi:hypothetical protein
MFGARNTYIDNSFRGPSTIVEKRAPTDESVRLLKEMEEAARRKVEETIVVADTSFQCKIQKIYDAMSIQDVYHVSYSMNGLKQTVQIRVDRHEQLSPTQVACTIRDKVAVDIANVMLTTAFTRSFD